MKMKMRNVVAAGVLAALAAGAARGGEKTSAASHAGVPLGYRAVSVPVSGEQVQFLKKGDRVDAMVTFEALLKDGIKEKATATILQNVLVLDVIRPTKVEDKGVAELILNPNEAQYMALSLMQGSVVLARRGDGDVEMHPMEMASFRKLFQ
jgi:Flp pilus assembly protein CpaB